MMFAGMKGRHIMTPNLRTPHIIQDLVQVSPEKQERPRVGRRRCKGSASLKMGNRPVPF